MVYSSSYLYCRKPKAKIKRKQNTKLKFLRGTFSTLKGLIKKTLMSFN